MAPVWKCDRLLKRRTALDYVNSVRVNSRCSFRLSSNLFDCLTNALDHLRVQPNSLFFPSEIYCFSRIIDDRYFEFGNEKRESVAFQRFSSCSAKAVLIKRGRKANRSIEGKLGRVEIRDRRRREARMNLI